MIEGLDLVLEVGCGDAFWSRVVAQHCKSLHAVDVNRSYVGSAVRNNPKERNPRVWLNDWDIMKGPLKGYDAVYCLDVFEHIKEEDVLLMNLRLCAPMCIIGIPSLESQAHASDISKLEHVNCKTKDGLRTSMKRYWKHVLMFGMNDETLHTGIMPAYIFGIGMD